MRFCVLEMKDGFWNRSSKLASYCGGDGKLTSECEGRVDPFVAWDVTELR